MLVSKLVNENDFKSDWFKNSCLKLHEPFQYHRKLWEFCYIYQGLLERGLLRPNKEGLGFGVGKEPLAAAFASHGCVITATDLDLENAKQLGWIETNQHCNKLADLNERKICNPEEFEKLVTFEYQNMNSISEKYTNKFDFTWSSCAFEHCGSLELGKQFIINQMKCLKPGGVAIHTTEFNLSSNDKTLDNLILALFRKTDIEWIVQHLRKLGHHIEIDYSIGTGQLESYIDTPPYTNIPHIRLQLDEYTSTSIGLIIHKKE